jgi:hypothetical protein
MYLSVQHQRIAQNALYSSETVQGRERFDSPFVAGLLTRGRMAGMRNVRFTLREMLLVFALVATVIAW